MARIERKVHYVGTWREDIVTDTFMRQIIARSMAEKGQKVKVKLSKDGLIVSKTVLMQESYLSTFSLQDVYFLTVNQRHPTCLLCIVADPVRKYLILALRTANEVEAQELISTFKSLKDNPAINAGNVVLRRKDNGNWTLRERSQQNADRHLQEIFQDTTTTNNIITPHLSQPNGTAGQEYSPVLDAQKVTTHNGRHVYKLVPDSRDEGDGGGGEVISSTTKEVDDLSQELRDVKFVVEKSGSVSSATLKNNLANNNNNTEKSHYIVTDLTTKRAEPVLNGGVARAHSNGHSNDDERAGEVRIAVNDHRQDGIVRAQSNGSANPASSTTLNGGFRQRITVPEPKGPITITATTTRTTPQNPESTNGYSDVPAYQIKRRVSTEYVTVPDFSRKVSQGGSVRSLNRVSFDPQATQFNKDRHAQFRSVRMSRSSAVPTTIIRPIEEIYGHGHAVPRHAYVKRHSGVYIPQPTPVLVTQQQPQPGNAVYVSHPVATLHRRSRPNSIHVMEGNELKVFHKTGDLDDLLL